MEFTVNYLAVIVSAIISMVVGAIWYGPLFGKKWMKIVGGNTCTEAERVEMQKDMKWLYVIQFIITLLQVWVLASFINGWNDFDSVKNILWLWAGFVVPTIAAGAMWNNDSKKVSMARFLIQGGYQLVMFIIFGFILTFWK